MKVLRLDTFQFRNKKQKCNLFCLLKESVQMFLEENCKFVNQTLHYSNEFNNFIVCHRKLSFHITILHYLF